MSEPPAAPLLEVVDLARHFPIRNAFGLRTGSIRAVDGVSLMEFGTPEAMWHLTVKDFPAIVTMDAHGNSLHKDIEQESARELAALGK